MNKWILALGGAAALVFAISKRKSADNTNDGGGKTEDIECRTNDIVTVSHSSTGFEYSRKFNNTYNLTVSSYKYEGKITVKFIVNGATINGSLVEGPPTVVETVGIVVNGKIRGVKLSRPNGQRAFIVYERTAATSQPGTAEMILDTVVF